MTTTGETRPLVTRTRRVRVAGAGGLAKRCSDVVLTSLVLVPALPVLLAVWLLVRTTSSGPALFRQERVGLDGRPFVLLKFRSMYHGADERTHKEYVTRLLRGQVVAEDGLFKLSHDDRVTPVGRFIRRFSLDELPQLLNVVRGDMSLVGPRPALPWEVEMFPPWARSRFDVRPGITGLWQVSGRNRLTMLAGLELDVEYVSRRSFAFDVMILLRTLPAVLRRGGR